MGRKRAVFLDRDGTIIQNRHYGWDPAKIQLLDGVVPGLKLLQESGYSLIVVTNQSGIARGHFTERDLWRMHFRLSEILAEQGVAVTAYYYCPHHPDGIVPEYKMVCNCRKPKPGMVLRARDDWDLDLASSWLIGDILDDVEAGKSVGCRAVLLDLGTEPPPQNEVRTPDFVAQGFEEAAGFIVSTSFLMHPTRRVSVRSL